LLNLLNSLPTFFSCHWHVWGDHLKEEVKSYPPDSAVSMRVTRNLLLHRDIITYSSSYLEAPNPFLKA
jgi:hypothetical protein